MRRVVSLVIILLFVSLSSLAVYGQTVDTLTGEHIRNFAESVSIKSDGKIEVVEHITYDFGDLEKHGIYRTIPLKKTNADGKKFKLSWRLISVTDENNKQYRYQESEEDNTVTIKIGDPNHTISGVHEYFIDYEIGGALAYFPDHDELYWNVTGTDWDVPIATASATVLLPNLFQGTITTACYGGYQGSNSSDCQASSNGTKAFFATNQYLNDNQGLTIVAGFPKGAVAVLEPKEIVNFFDTYIGKITGMFIWLAVIIAALWWYIIYPIRLAYKWWRYGRDPQGTIGITQAWFDGPKTDQGQALLPAITGTIIDERADFADISATIIHLAQRGYLKIEERKKNDFYFIKRKDWDDDLSLAKFERTLLNGIFSGTAEVRIKDKKLYVTIQNVQQDIYDEVVRQKFFPDDPQKIRNFYTGIAAAALTTFNLPLLLSAWIFGRNLPHKTVSGVNAANVAKSLKSFLTSQERQLEFQAKKQLMFEKLLPFAIAFGVEEIWARRFGDLKMKQPEWYQGYGISSYNPYLFTRSMNSSFTSVQSAAAPPRSSSGFSSGFSGGSSGGGGGGGGGGSW